MGIYDVRDRREFRSHQHIHLVRNKMVLVPQKLIEHSVSQAAG